MVCGDDCPPSWLVTALIFLIIASIGLVLARWRRWTLLVWVPLSYIGAAPFLTNGWGIDDRGWLAMAAAWVIALFAAFRRRPPSRADEAA